ncbi:MAG: HEPN domain-containing protein [Lachnospiraceae bacterium]|nr:HEPN domain-containing protein [Lachnospiraceae bacterium]
MDDLIKYRLSSAKEKLNSAKVLLEAGLYKDSVGRSYYAIFSAIRAVLAVRQVDFSKHAGVIVYFQKEFIKTEVFDKKYSKYLQQAFQIRNSCDYDDFFIVSKQDAEEQYIRATEMLTVIEEYIGQSRN